MYPNNIYPLNIGLGNDPKLAVDDAGIMYLMYRIYNGSQSTIAFTRSLDGGISFEEPVPLENILARFYPVDEFSWRHTLAVSDNNTVYLVVVDNRQSGIYFIRSLQPSN